MSDESAGSEIQFDRRGLGNLIAGHFLAVPINQRSYAWKEEHVEDLLQDFQNAIKDGEKDYFLGTIVLTRGGRKLEVADGQQRLATATILLSAIRDHLFAKNDKRCAKIEQAYLTDTDLITEEPTPRLQLNVDDDEFFKARILSAPDSPQRAVPPTKESHRRIAAAAARAAGHVQNMVKLYGANAVQRLLEWVLFIKEHARVIVVSVPDHANAFVIFETLNDRGLELSKSDLLKNYLFGRAGTDHLKSVQTRWAEMSGSLETVSGEDDLTATYIRHLWISLHGYTREKELYKKIKDTIRTKQAALDFAGDLASASRRYVALMNSSHELWIPYPPRARRCVAQINQMGWKQVRPLMLAINRKFTPKEADKAYRLFVCWTVRYLICGGLGSGSTEQSFAECAKQVSDGKVTTAKGVYENLLPVLPSDAEFEAAFAIARVSKATLARYYLRAMELQSNGAPEPELVPNENEDEITLEHILPQTPSAKEWPDVDADEAVLLNRRLGNLVLLRATDNQQTRNDFAAKVSLYKKCAYTLTKMAGECKSWGAKEIAKRQKQLATLAVKTWPLTAK